MKTAIRSGRLEIDTVVPGGPQWITSSIQRLELDANGNITAQHFRDDKLYRRVEQVALELITITDPVTGLTGSMSVAGVGVAIKQLMIKWMLEDNPSATYDADLDMVCLSDTNS